jgi:hypothetical protein
MRAKVAKKCSFLVKNYSKAISCMHMFACSKHPPAVAQLPGFAKVSVCWPLGFSKTIGHNPTNCLSITSLSASVQTNSLLTPPKTMVYIVGVST